MNQANQQRGESQHYNNNNSLHLYSAFTWNFHMMMRRCIGQPYCVRSPSTHQLPVERRQSDEANQ